MPAWVLAAFAAAAAFVPVGVYFAISFIGGYTVSGYGTGTALDAAPGPLLGAGIVPAMLVIGAAYRFVRRSRQRPADK